LTKQLKFPDLSAFHVSANPHHDRMVEALGRYLARKLQVNITGTALAGHNQPKIVNGCVPDVEGVESFSGYPVFGEAEECDTYADEHARDHLDIFSRVLNGAVFLVVPASCYAAAETYVQSMFPGRNITVLPYGKE
jgi:hypothetical protein